MSAESPVSRTDVASDGPATGDARPNHSGGTPRGGDTGPAGDADQPTRARRNRRGRRRRGRRGKNPAQQPGDAQNTPAGETTAGGDAPGSAEKPRPAPAQPGRPKPGPRRPVHGGGPGGSAHPRKNVPPARDGQGPATGQQANGQQAGGRQPSERPAVGVDASPKPSDLAARRQSADAASREAVAREPAEVATRRPPADAGRRQRDQGTPAAMPRTKRRNGGHRRPESSPDSTGNANHQRLRTVRETSAGGLVLSSLDAPFDEIEAVLIGRIDRRGRMMWSLPKGHIETGETAETTAIREVEEETGVSGTIVAPLGKIDYWFVSEGRRIHKTVHHFLLRYAGGELSDADYEVSEVAWVRLTDLPRRLTYSDERRLARAVEEVVAELRDDPDRLARSEAEAIRTEPNEYEKAAAARNQRRNDPPPPPRPRRRKRRPRRGGGGQRDTVQGDAGARGDTASRGETGPATPDTDRGSSAG